MYSEGIRWQDNYLREDLQRLYDVDGSGVVLPLCAIRVLGGAYFHLGDFGLKSYDDRYLCMLYNDGMLSIWILLSSFKNCFLPILSE